LTLYLLVYTVLALPGKRLQANLLLPLIAPLALLAGYGVVRLYERWAARRQVVIALAVLLLAWPATLSALFVYRIATPDTRLRAQAWIYAHVPRGTTVHLLGPYNVPLDPLDYATTQSFDRSAGLEAVQRADTQIIVTSDARPFVALRDPALASDAVRAQERKIREILQTEWTELVRFKRMSWPGQTSRRTT